MQSSDINELKRNALVNAVDDALLSLGVSIRNALLWHMSQRGFELDSKVVDIDQVYSSLGELIGPGADLIMDKVFEKLQSYGSNLESGSSLEKIHNIMNMTIGEEMN